MSLQSRQKWNKKRRNLQTDDIVLIKGENTKRNVWSLGRVTRTYPDKHGVVRSVPLKTHASELRRPIHKLVLLLSADEQ